MKENEKNEFTEEERKKLVGLFQKCDEARSKVFKPNILLFNYAKSVNALGLMAIKLSQEIYPYLKEDKKESIISRIKKLNLFAEKLANQLEVSSNEKLQFKR